MNKIEIRSDVQFLEAADAAAASPRKFRIVAYTGSPIRQGWSREPVVIDVAGMKLPKTVPVVLGHEYSLAAILGKGTPSVVDGQLVVEGEVLAESPAANQVVQLAAAGYEWQASVGADVRRHQKFDVDTAATVNGQTHVGPVRVVKASALREVSFVTLGADPETSVAIAATEVVEEEPMAADATTKPADEVLEASAAVAPAEVAVVDEQPNVTVSAETEGLKAEVEQLKKEIVKMKELEQVRASRAAAPSVQSEIDGDRVIEAALALQGGLPNVEKRYDERTLEAADKAARNVSLAQVVLRAAMQNGYDGPQRLTSATLGPVLRAAWTTHSIAGILSSTVNKFLLAGFDSVESAWRQISTTRSVNDFKTLTSYRLNGGFKFEKVANGGELQNAAASDETRTISADTYGIMTSVTRQDLINDDLGALTAVPQRIGRGGALKLNDVFWAAFVDDASFFTADRGNLRAGSHALSLANLKSLATLYRKLKDPDGNPVAIEPRILLVPPDLELTAAEIMGSSLIQAGTTTGPLPERNVLAGRYQVVSSVYLTNTTDYYLLASPADLPVMEVAFLNGVQSPIVETAEADFNTLGVQMRGYFDFGCAKAEYLAGVKCDSAA